MVDKLCTVIITAKIRVNINGVFKIEEISDRKILIIKGIKMTASNSAENGSGLKSKYWPFENGKVNKRIMPIATIRKTPQDIRKSIIPIFGKGSVLMFLYTPIIAPKDTKSIPIVRTK